MSSISGTSGNHYISNADFLGWMQEKTNGIYTKMSDAMDVSNDRSDAEDALNSIKAKVADAQAGKADPNELYAAVNQAMDKFGKEFPEMKEALTQISQELEARGAKLPDGTLASGETPYIPPAPEQTLDSGDNITSPNPAYATWLNEWGAVATQHPELVMSATPAQITIDDDTSKRWQDSIKGQVDSLSSQDQLGLINIQEYSSQLNQAKQTASALMDSADKAAQAIISHIG